MQKNFLALAVIILLVGGLFFSYLNLPLKEPAPPQQPEISGVPQGDAVICKPEDRKGGVCTKELRPVCGTVNVQCIKAPCDPIKETFANSCLACSNTLVESYTAGSCPEN